MFSRPLAKNICADLKKEVAQDIFLLLFFSIIEKLSAQSKIGINL